MRFLARSRDAFAFAGASAIQTPRATANAALVVMALIATSTPMASAEVPPLPLLVEVLPSVDSGAGDELGRAVAYKEPFMTAGAWGASSEGMPLHGAAAAWRWSPGGWVQEAVLLASDRAANDRFGVSVTVARPTLSVLPRSVIVVGAHGADPGDLNDAGAAYVFRRTLGGTWLEETKLVASDPQANAQFGRVVAMDGDLLAVSAPQRNNLRGAVYLFRVSAGPGGTPTWTQEAILTSSDIFAGDTFGASVAVAGDTVVVGAPGADIGTSVNRGAAYVFSRAGAVWQQRTKLVAPGGEMLDEFGRVVAIDSEALTIVVGTSPTLSSQLGVAHVHTRVGDAWVHEAVLAPEQPQVGEQFASTLAVERARVVIGAPSRTVNGEALRGAVSIYRFTPLGWVLESTMTDAQGAAGDSFGAAVAFHGEGAVIGAKGVDRPGAANSGAVAVAWVEDCNGDQSFGICGNLNGDFNGDGVVDGNDLGTLLGWWGVAEPWSPADLTGDGIVNGSDLGVLLGQWS